MSILTIMPRIIYLAKVASRHSLLHIKMDYFRAEHVELTGRLREKVRVKVLLKLEAGQATSASLVDVYLSAIKRDYTIHQPVLALS